MRPIVIPKSYNYTGIFLTFACNYHCSYCINRFEENLVRRKTISGEDWVKGLNRIVSPPDLPVTLQGGEPSCHPDFIHIVSHLKPELSIDILTNIAFDVEEFMRKVPPGRVKRKAPYASIRVSYHPEVMDLEETIEKVSRMLEKGYSIGIWGVLHPKQKDLITKAQERCRKLGIDFRTKEFLGKYEGDLHGEYKYEGASSKKFRKRVECKTTEILVDSEGKIYRCHYDIYKGINPIGNLLDPDFQIEDKFRECENFGHCNPCDVKIKTNRFQIFGHTSVEIRETKTKEPRG